MQTKQPSKNSIQNKDSFLENKKNECLASVYKRDAQSLGQFLKDAVFFAKKQTRLTENDEKALRQILAIFKQFKPAVLEFLDQEGIDTCHALKKLLVKTTRQQRQAVTYIELSFWKQQVDLNTDQLALVFKTAMTFQLTSGCSHFCRRCNEWALPGVRFHFSYQTILFMLDQMVVQGNEEISLYGASDPLDWKEKTLSIVDILRHINMLPMHYSLLSKVPKGEKAVLVDLLKHRANISVSVTAKNKQRIQNIESKIPYPLYKQHDSDDLLIQAGMDEDFTTVKPSITDGYGTEITPDGAFIIIPTFTSALHPFGHKKIAITPETWFFPEKKTGRHALLVDYFKPLKGYDLNKNPVCLSYLLDVQIESILLDNGQNHLTPPGMTSFKEFLTIFDAPARLRRKQMTRSVFKRLKSIHLEHAPFKKLSISKQKIYIEKIKCHLQLCSKKACMELKLYAFSYFLDAINTYTQNNPLKSEIIRFLIKAEIERTPSIKDKMTAGSIIDNILNPKMDDFKLFRYYTICLLIQAENRNILKFIKDYKACYDTVTDVFIRASNDH